MCDVILAWLRQHKAELQELQEMYPDLRLEVYSRNCSFRTFSYQRSLHSDYKQQTHPSKIPSFQSTSTLQPHDTDKYEKASRPQKQAPKNVKPWDVVRKLFRKGKPWLFGYLFWFYLRYQKLETATMQTWFINTLLFAHTALLMTATYKLYYVFFSLQLLKHSAILT